MAQVKILEGVQSQQQNNAVGLISEASLEQGSKVFWTDELEFEIFWSNRMVCVQQRVDERDETPCITTTIKRGGGAFANCW